MSAASPLLQLEAVPAGDRHDCVDVDHLPVKMDGDDGTSTGGDLFLDVRDGFIEAS